VINNSIKKFFTSSKINKIILYLTYSDILLISSWGLISPIIAVFFTDNIPGADIVTAGVASTIFFITRSILQIPVAKYIDTVKGEKDNYTATLFGTFIVAIIPFFYMMISSVTQLYLIQILYGIGSAVCNTGWLTIFTKHLDKDKEGLEWSFYNTTTDLGSALTASIGGFLAYKVGFTNLFFLVGVINLIGFLFIFFLKGSFLKRKSQTV